MAYDAAMEIDEKITRLRTRMGKAEDFFSRLGLLTKLSERVFRDAAKLETRLKDIALIGSKEADIADKKAAQMAKALEKSEITRDMKAANEGFQKAMADPEKFAETVDDPTIDELLDAALARSAKSQAELENQLFDLQTIGAELDRELNKKPPPRRGFLIP